ncbi:transcriptional regulator [Nocardia lijiangensis]|uniref:transcriptional regulator n=1 Tax=Nocardia lijiangensis TaxID=299618 RepID=UPI00082A3C6E|nr:transcriptional regulator [Nocardia lijiangensis]
MAGTQAGSGTKTLRTKLVEHLRYPARGVPPGDLATITRSCLADAMEALDPGTFAAPPEPAEIAGTAIHWAREGIALETVLGAYHDGIRTGLEFLAAQAGDAGSDQVVAGAGLIVRALEMVTVAASTAYVEEHRLVAKEHQTAAQTLVSALLSGHGVAQLARQTGISVAPTYQVVAVSIPPHSDELRPGGGATAGRRKLRRVQAALAKPLGSRALSLLSTEGGTVLVPIDDVSALTPLAMTAEVLEVVSEAAEVPLTATITAGVRCRIPELVGRVHDLLGRIRAANRPPGLYPMADLGESIGCDTPQRAGGAVVTSSNKHGIGRPA